MLATLDSFSGLHRMVPGREKEPLVYPPKDAVAPLNLYQSGIPLGPYRVIASSSTHQLGGFDEDYAPADYEESDFCVRLKKAGKRTV